MRQFQFIYFFAEVPVSKKKTFPIRTEEESAKRKISPPMTENEAVTIGDIEFWVEKRISH